jgi:hypothetical protein
MIKASIKSKEIFADQIKEDFKSYIAGSGDKFKKIVGKSPENMFYVGKLSAGQRADNEFSSDVFIQSLGLDFIIKYEDISETTLDITVGGDFFYRIIPTYEEQVYDFVNRINQVFSIDCKNVTEAKEYLKTNDKKFETDLVLAFKRLSLLEHESLFSVSLRDELTRNPNYFRIKENHPLNKQLNNHIKELIAAVFKDKQRYRAIRDKVRIDDVISERAFATFIQRNQREEINLTWDIVLDVTGKKYQENNLRITTSLVNNSIKNDSTVREEAKNKPKRIYTLFNSKLTIKNQGSKFVPIKMNYFEDDYKYDRNQYAVGNNCSIVYDKEDVSISTNTLPEYKQYRLKTKDEYAVPFKDLINNPIDTLKYLHSEMLKELENWEQQYQNKEKNLTIKGKTQFKKEIEDFRIEIKRFKSSIEVIKNNTEVKKAFVLTNEAFFKTFSKDDGSWRAFQIVFIVSLILDIVSCDKNYLIDEERMLSRIEQVDLLYYPTGGGKTEAFLGVLVFNIFFDRFRGKKVGVTGILKYPLRLLSIQQVQRVSNVLAQAEMIRREISDIRNSEPFSIGYYVGSGNTPNKLDQETVESIKQLPQEALNEKYKMVDVCPFCKSEKIDITYSEHESRLKHVCKASDCQSGDELPIYIVDTEIYRYVPTVIIGTIDKQAALGLQSNFRNLLGGIIARCPKHGYTSKLTCIVSNCEETLESIELYDPAPSLVIQDELHLIRESLGVFNAHYESLMEYFVKELSPSKRPFKIIGATATISAYEQQISHLYAKSAIRFPAQSPDVNENFYSKVDTNELHRNIIGFAPFGKAIINSVAYSMMYMKEIIQGYKNDFESMFEIPNIGISTEDEALNILEDYWILLEYNNVKMDGNKVINAIEGPINTELAQKGFQKYTYVKMTGDDSFQDVRRVLSKVENMSVETVFDDFNLIVATSMISHGVDADRFNTMFFFGIPGNTAEYIQAYSRAGRKYTGLIVLIMRPSRENDRSYLRNFVKFHEYKDILVEAVPINRWATKAVKRTLPGILSGLILNHYDLKHIGSNTSSYTNMKGIQEAINRGLLERSEIIQHILKIYGCVDTRGNFVPTASQYRAYIEDTVNKFFDSVPHENYNSREKNLYITAGLENIIGRPMTSLRDTDDTVTIEVN